MRHILYTVAVKLFPRIENDFTWVMRYHSLYCFLYDPIHTIRFWFKYRLDKHWKKEIDDLRQQVETDMREFLAQYPDDD